MPDRYQVVDCSDGRTWAFPERLVAMVCAGAVHARGHEVEVVVVRRRDDGRFTAQPVTRLRQRAVRS